MRGYPADKSLKWLVLSHQSQDVNETLCISSDRLLMPLSLLREKEDPTHLWLACGIHCHVYDKRRLAVFMQLSSTLPVARQVGSIQ